MNKFRFLICFCLVFLFASCFSSPPKNDEPEPMIYFYRNPSAQYVEFESISLSGQSSFVIYSVDRDDALIMMEMGSYLITDGVIVINAGKFQAVGTITDEKIVINGKEFIRL